MNKINAKFSPGDHVIIPSGTEGTVRWVRGVGSSFEYKVLIKGMVSETGPRDREIIYRQRELKEMTE